MASRRKSRRQWYRVDLHIHTPASFDYQDTDAGYMDILHRAEQQALDIIAFTDHNTVKGYGQMQQEVTQLAYLASLNRATPDELGRLAEYHRLLEKILVLPGFEFTATFGFHVLGVFSPETSVRELEHLLLDLNVPLDVMDEGRPEVGASSDVLTAYRLIDEAGGICIAAHVNAAHGVAMKGVNFGGQTRIAYTQDSHLHALEATDLAARGRNTPRFFDGTKPEYPRKMRVIQGSDAHSLHTAHDDRGRVTRWGVGERTTEVLLPERSFEALREMFQGNDFSRSRPFTPDRKPKDYIEVAREEGPTVVQSFYETTARKGGHMYNIVADVCAFANTNGGTIYIGVNPNASVPPIGVRNVSKAIDSLRAEIDTMISPALSVEIDTLETQGKTVIRLQVPYGKDRPYAIENSKIYVREDADTSLAIRDEIVELVRQGLRFQGQPEDLPPAAPLRQESQEPSTTVDHRPDAATLDGDLPDAGMDPANAAEDADRIKPPQAGVEIVGSELRDDTRYYMMRDLRNGNVVQNVTQKSARRLWHYAIKQKETNPVRADQVQWRGEIGLWRVYRKGGAVRYDLVQKDNGVRVYYGVTEGGMHGPWQQFLANEDDVITE